MTDQTRPTGSDSGWKPTIVGALAAFFLMVGIVVGIGALYGYLALSESGLERLQLTEPAAPPEPDVYGLAHPFVETLDVQEGLDEQAIRDRLLEDRALFEQCYRDRLDDIPGLGGEIAFQFSVDTTGDVAATVVRDNRTNSQQLADCVLEAIEADWSFPPPETEGLATVRFHALFVPLQVPES